MFPTLSLLLLTSSPFLVHGKTQLEKMDEGPQIYNSSWFGIEHFNYDGRRDGPFDVPLDKWNDLLDDPTTTGDVSIPIPDLTKPFTEKTLNISRLNALPQRYERGSGWKWSLDLADNIPITLPKEDGGGEGVATGVRLRLHAPAVPRQTIEDMDDSWQVCVIQWNLKEGTNTSTFYRMHTQPECMLPSECIRDMQNYAASGPAGFGRCQCPDPKTFESCKDAYFPEWATCSVKPWKAPDVRKWKNSTLEVMNYAGRPHYENDNGFGFNATSLITWPVMVVWALEGDAPPDNTLSSSSTTTTLRSLTTETATRVGTISPSSVDEPTIIGPSTTNTVTTTVTNSSADEAASTGTGNAAVVDKRQNREGDGPRFAAAKLSCVSPWNPVEGKPEAGLPVVEQNAAGGVPSSSSFSLLVLSGLAAAVLALI